MGLGRDRKTSGVWTDMPLATKGLLVVSIPLFFLIVLTLAFYFAERGARAAEDSVRHTLEVLNRIHTVRSRMEEAETGIRGYLITHSDALLAPYRDAESKLPEILDDLEASVRDNPDQHVRAGRIKEIAMQRLSALSSLAGAARADGERATATAREAILSGKDSLDDIRRELADARSAEEQLLQQRLARQRRAWDLSSAIIVAGILFIPASGILAMMLFTSGVAGRVKKLDQSARQLAKGEPVRQEISGADEIGTLESSVSEAASLLVARERELRAARDELGIRVQERTAALARANEALQGEITERSRAEQQFREAHETLEAVIQASPLAIIRLDLEGNVRSWNKAAEAMFGWAEQEVAGRPLPTVPEDAADDFQRPRKDIFRIRGAL